MKQRIACYFVIYHRREAVVFSFFFIFPRKLDRVQIRKHPNNWKNERLINLLAWLINNFLPKYDQEIRNFEDQLSIYPFPPPLEKRNIYIYIRVPNLIIEGITFQWIPRPDRKARPLIRVTHRNTTKFNLSGMSAHRDNEQRGLTNGLHVTPNNKVARFSSGWIAVNIVDGH